MQDVDHEKLGKGLARLGIGASDRQYQALECLVDQVRLWNPSYRLVADSDHLVERHILDSLSGLNVIAALNPRYVADVGSGAGFPAIPLALFLPKCSFVLIERMGRRAGFLRNLVLLLKLKTVTVLEAPLEQAAGTCDGFDVVTFRAWSPFTGRSLDAVARILSPGGRIAAYKGRRRTVEDELAAVGNRVASCGIVPVPGFAADRSNGAERHIVVLSLRE